MNKQFMLRRDEFDFNPMPITPQAYICKYLLGGDRYGKVMVNLISTLLERGVIDIGDLHKIFEEKDRYLLVEERVDNPRDLC